MSSMQGEMAESNARPRVQQHTGEPSKVLHVRNLPPDCTEAELFAIGHPFGRVVTVLILKGKNQGFIQMEDAMAAGSLIGYYSTAQALIRGQPVYFAFSSREEITHTATNQAIQPSPVLLISVVNLLYPITIEVLQQVFSKYGNILRVIIFTKNAGFQALMEYDSVNSSISAKEALDGQNIYSGCCTLQIQYSTTHSLQVKYNNEKSRDFMNSSLPAGSSPSYGGGYPGTDHHMSMSNNPEAGYSPSGSYPMSSPSQPANTPYVSAPGSPHHSRGLQHDSLNGLNPGMGAPGGVGPNGRMGVGNVGHMGLHGVHSVGVSGVGVGGGLGGLMGGNPVVLVSGFDAGALTPDGIFTLFGVYGDVMRVKVLYNKKDHALVQFASPGQAQYAVTHLNGVSLHGKILMVSVSKHASVAMPRPGTEQESSGLTKDFSSSPLHRYKNPGSKNYQHITAPSATLHLSNLPEDIEESSILGLFEPWGPVRAFKFFTNNRKMAVLQLPSVDAAMQALMGTHNAPLGESNLRVSFSKSGFRDDHSSSNPHALSSANSSSGPQGSSPRPDPASSDSGPDHPPSEPLDQPGSSESESPSDLGTSGDVTTTATATTTTTIASATTSDPSTPATDDDEQQQ